MTVGEADMSSDTHHRKPKRDDFVRALQSMNTYIDIEVDDLMTLAERAEHFSRQRSVEMLSVSSVMSQPVQVVRPDAKMAEAAHLMIAKRISGLPVVDDAGSLLGIITEADFLRGLGVPSQHPSHNLWQTLESLFNHLAHRADLEGPNDSVSEHMVCDVICVAIDDNLDDVLAVMKQRRVKRVVVCDEGKQVVGMVTRSDLVRVFFDKYLGDRTRDA